LAAGTEVIELRQIERALKWKIERLHMGAEVAGPPRRRIQNTLASRTLSVLPGEVFVQRRQVLLPGRQAPAACVRQAAV
jgi:hypothetical protein